MLFQKDSPMVLKSGDARFVHLREVLKTPDGGEVFAGRVGCGLKICAVRTLSDGSIALDELRDAPDPSPLSLSLAVAYARPQIAQRILFEAACFGASRLVFYPAEKGEAAYAKSSLYVDKEFERWLVKGAEQACASSIPEFIQADNLCRAISVLSDCDRDLLKLAPDVYEAQTSLLSALSTRPADCKKALIFGGERGFSCRDRLDLRDGGYTLVSLGRRVLRTDSAVIAALGAVAEQ